MIRCYYPDMFRPEGIPQGINSDNHHFKRKKNTITEKIIIVHITNSAEINNSKDIIRHIVQPYNRLPKPSVCATKSKATRTSQEDPGLAGI